MRTPAIPPDAPPDEYLDRLSATLGVDRSRLIVSARTPDEPAPSERRRRRAPSLARQATAACTVAALGSCLFLYWGKSQAALADREIGRILRATQQAHARIDTLRAEWALLNQPDRLRDMADHHLPLRPIAPAQYCEADQLGSRLQAPVATPADGGAEAEPAMASADDQGAPAASPEAPPPTTTTPLAPAERLAALPETAQPAAQPDAAPRRPHTHMPTARYLTPTIAEARQAVRVRDTGEALLNGDPEPARIHARILRASALGAPPRTELGLRSAHRLPIPKIDLPRWLMQAHLMRPGRSDPPHALELPQGRAIPLAAPQPEAAPLQRVSARPAPPPEYRLPEHPPLLEAAPPEAAPSTDESPRYRPAYHRNYAYYGAPYRPYWRQAYGDYGGGGPYGNGYANPYYRGYAPPSPPGAYYQ